VQSKEYFFVLGDFVNKLIWKLHAIVTPIVGDKVSLSDSEKTPYIKYVKKVISSQTEFSKFRRNYQYRIILEHVTRKQGDEYLLKTSRYSSNLLNFQEQAKSLSRIGNPRVFSYDGFGQVSPTILRYMATAAEINHLFEFKESSVVTEVGIGYGGQLAMLSSLINISEYKAYDLPCVQDLSKKFLKDSGCLKYSDSLSSMDIYNLDSHPSDLFISNYAFSELPINVQTEYLLKIASHSKYGYMMMNSGLLNRTGRSSGKISIELIRNIIPNIQLFPESPLTGPDNYLITWGNTKEPII
jgi:putative sugar O-methyltransferase